MPTPDIHDVAALDAHRDDAAQLESAANSAREGAADRAERGVAVPVDAVPVEKVQTTLAASGCCRERFTGPGIRGPPEEAAVDANSAP